MCDGPPVGAEEALGEHNQLLADEADGSHPHSYIAERYRSDGSLALVGQLGGCDPPGRLMPWVACSGICLTREDVLQGWQSHNGRILARLRPGADDEFLLQQSLKDAEKGFCSDPMDATALHHAIRTSLHHAIRTEPYRLIPRVITQSSGKQRVIDDAYVGLQSERSSDANKLTLCSALRPD